MSLSASQTASSHGFGEYNLPEGRTFAEMQRCTRVEHTGKAMLACAGVVGSIFCAPITTPIPAAFAAENIGKAMGTCYQAPPTQELMPSTLDVTSLGQTSSIPCSGFPTKDGVESHQWKLELIRAAKHSIVFSGCYAGGPPFQEALELMRDRMRINPHLTAHILVSNMYITDENQALIKTMQQEFGDRFNCLITTEMFPYTSPVTGELSITSNHTKAVVIDGGAYFMLGGSGMVNCWTDQPGVATPTRDPNEPLLTKVSGMRAFRDVDFVFKSDMNGVGTRLHVEMRKLFEVFRYRQESQQKPIARDWPNQVETSIPAFEERQNKVDDMKVAFYATGPEEKILAYEDAMIHEIENAQESIVMNHMIFKPSSRMKKALINASNRGIDITILKNRCSEKSPITHATYISDLDVQELFEGREKPNIKVFLYDVPSTTLHKKVMIVDRKTTMLGSANISKKSLDALDYEINLKIESEEFADTVTQSFEADKPLCLRLPDAEAPKISWTTHALNWIQMPFKHCV